MTDILPKEIIAEKIFVLRGQKVMLDRDLAKLYGVETKYLKRQVKRNIDRFPIEFMFELTKEELENWRGQIGTLKNASGNLRGQFGTSSGKHGGTRYLPLAFTEHGIVMLSSVLRSPKAIEINILIIKVFNQMRKILATNQELFNKIEVLENKILENNESIQLIWFEIKKMLVDDEIYERKIGFRV